MKEDGRDGSFDEMLFITCLLNRYLRGDSTTEDYFWCANN